MPQGYAVIWSTMGYFEISGHGHGTCHNGYRLCKGPKNPAANPLQKHLFSVLEFPNITFIRHVQTLEALTGNARGLSMVSDTWQLILDLFESSNIYNFVILSCKLIDGEKLWSSGSCQKLVTYSQGQKIWEKLLFGQFCISLPFSLLTMLRNNERILRRAMLWVHNIVWGKGGILKALFKILVIFCHWLSEIYKKNNEEVRSMLFQITQICFNESDCAMLHCLMRIMTENGAKMTQKLPQ